MSLDERIRQLSGTIIEEVRGPIEAALHHLLADVMTIAAADRDQAVQTALAEAAASHESATAVLREQHDRERVDVEALRAQFGRELDASLAALREQLDREHQDALDELRQSLADEHAAALTELVHERDEAHTTALAGLVQEREEASAAELDALRRQLDQAHDEALGALRLQHEQEREAALAAAAADIERERESALGALRDELNQNHEAALAALRNELAIGHEAALKAALEAAAEEADRVRRAETEAMAAQAARDHHAALQAFRTELESASANDREAALHALRSELEATAAADRESALLALRAEFAGREESPSSEADRPAAAEQAKQEAESRARALELERDDARAQAVAARQAASDVEQNAGELELRLHEAHALLRESEQRVMQLEMRLHDADQRAAVQEQGATLIHAAIRHQDTDPGDRTLAWFRRLDAAGSLTEVFAVLAEQAEAEIGRAAIFMVHGSRLRGWDVRGLPGVQPSSLDASIEPDSIFERAVESGLPVSTTVASLGVAGFGPAELLAVPEGCAGLAVPISVGGRVVAILYADDVGGRLPAATGNWPETAEILARHAGHRLEVLTVSHAAKLAGRVQQDDHARGWPPLADAPEGSPHADERREEESARRYARLLISEIKLYNEPAVEQGRLHGDLLRRLGDDIERARRLYEEKIPAPVRQRVNCFDQEVVRTLAGGDPGLLGQT